MCIFCLDRIFGVCKVDAAGVQLKEERGIQDLLAPSFFFARVFRKSRSNGCPTHPAVSSSSFAVGVPQGHPVSSSLTSSRLKLVASS